MGLYDGAAGAGEFASTAHVAQLLDAPVVLVVDAASQSRSVAALVHGFAIVRPRRAARRRDPQPGRLRPARGDLPRGARGDRAAGARRAAPPDDVVDAVAAPRPGPGRRAPPRGRSRTVERLGELVGASCDLRRSASRWRTPPGRSPPRRGSPRGRRRPPRPARGSRSPAARRSPSATPRTPSCWRPPAPRSCAFDPLRDDALPEGTGGVVIGGGFPEVLRRGAVGQRAAARVPSRRSGGPISAECAGLLYLARRARRRSDVRRARRRGADDRRG